MPSTKAVLDKAGVATRIAVAVLGPSAGETAIGDFALDLMTVPVERLQRILVALPGSETVDSECLPDRPSTWERLLDDPES